MAQALLTETMFLVLQGIGLNEEDALTRLVSMTYVEARIR